MKRGEIWTVASGPDYAGKPCPAVVLQDDRFDMTSSLTICAFTTTLNEAPLLRVPVKPSDANGLRLECQLMVDKIMTVPKTNFGICLGRLANEDMVRLNRAVVVFLGIGAPAPSAPADR